MVAALVGIVVGVSLGLTGGGGSILAVPLLIHGLGVAAREAIEISLVAVAATAAYGTVGASRARLIEYRAGLVFAAGGILAAPGGVRLRAGVSDTVLLAGFAGLMLVVALLMWRKASRDPAATAVVRAAVGDADGGGAVCRLEPDQRLRLTAPCSAALATAGVATGLLSGFFGVGGGFVIVPALQFVSQLGIHRAVATSLLVIALVASAAAGGALVQGHRLAWALTAAFTAGGIAGMTLGRVLARRLAGPTLQRVFALVIVAVAVVVLATPR